MKLCFSELGILCMCPRWSIVSLSQVWCFLGLWQHASAVEMMLKTHESCSVSESPFICAVLPDNIRHPLLEHMLLPLFKPTYRSVHLKMDSSLEGCILVFLRLPLESTLT